MGILSSWFHVPSLISSRCRRGRRPSDCKVKVIAEVLPNLPFHILAFGADHSRANATQRARPRERLKLAKLPEGICVVRQCFIDHSPPSGDFHAGIHTGTMLVRFGRDGVIENAHHHLAKDHLAVQTSPQISGRKFPALTIAIHKAFYQNQNIKIQLSMIQEKHRDEGTGKRLSNTT